MTLNVTFKVKYKDTIGQTAVILVSFIIYVTLNLNLFFFAKYILLPTIFPLMAFDK